MEKEVGQIKMMFGVKFWVGSLRRVERAERVAERNRGLRDRWREICKGLEWWR